MIAIRPAQEQDLDAIEALIRTCIADLDARGIFQWDERYPNRAFFAETIAEGALHALTVDGEIAAIAVLDESQSPAWDAVAWDPTPGRSMVVHALAVSPSRQGQRLGDRMLRFAEEHGRANGYDRIRLDAFAEHEAALRFYTNRGYAYRGAVRFSGKPAGHETYNCYEKLLAPAD